MSEKMTLKVAYLQKATFPPPRIVVKSFAFEVVGGREGRKGKQLITVRNMRENLQVGLLSLRNSGLPFKSNTTRTTQHFSFDGLSICTDRFLLNYLNNGL
jgi:hypothetical protein